VSETGDQVVPDCLPHHHCLDVRDTSVPSIKSYFLSSQTQPACFNAVRKVSHEVFYDTDNGVIRIETHYQRINLTGSRGYLRQFFQVKFTRLPSANETDVVQLQKEETVRSGNPGYIMSAPVLAALLPKDRVSNDSGTERTPVQRLQVPVLSSTDGICSQSAIKIQDVSFGVNFRSSCFVSQRLLHSLLQERSDNVCPKLQLHMTSMLGSSNVTHVAMFGNSNVSQSSEWIPIMSDKEWPQVGDASRTAPLSVSRKCPFLVTGFSYEIHFSFTGLIDQPQAKILSVVRRYRSEADIRIPAETSASQVDRPEHHVELSTSVSFFDMTHSRRTSLAPAPVLRLQLPADFFYPFFISFSSRPEASLPCSLIVLVLLFVRGRDGI
jgi:tectonic-1/3